MNRFFVEKKYIKNDLIEIIQSDDIHHLTNVLRLLPKEELFISDGEGSGYIAVTEKVAKNCILLKIKKSFKPLTREDFPILISLACAIPKKTSFNDILDKCGQLGINNVIPMITKRTLVGKDILFKKKLRYERILKSAAKQSGALFIPRLDEPEEFMHLLNKVSEYDICLLPNLLKRPISLIECLKEFKGKKILVMIGPEGDFTCEEIDSAVRKGCKAISLGDSVLRVDTAAISIVSFLKFYFG